jgi:hypothetical protein
MTEAIGLKGSQLRPLLPASRNWQRWLSGGISIALLVTILWKLSEFGLAQAWAILPATPLFWLAFASYYLALPASEWLIFRRLWGLPTTGFAALLRKLVCNEILVGYSGEVYFYTWARRHGRLVTAPFGAIKDVSILSALAGNLATLMMLALAWPLVGTVAPQFHGQILFLSAAAMITMSGALLLFRKRVFSLGGSDLRMIFAIHIARLVATTIFSGVMWHSALPDVPLGWLVLLATLQLLVTRLPLVPNKDLIFASLAVFLIGHDGAVGTAIAMIAASILAVHLIIGGLLVITELFEVRQQ